MPRASAVTAAIVKPGLFANICSACLMSLPRSPMECSAFLLCCTAKGGKQNEIGGRSLLSTHGRPVLFTDCDERPAASLFLMDGSTLELVSRQPGRVFFLGLGKGHFACSSSQPFWRSSSTA